MAIEKKTIIVASCDMRYCISTVTDEREDATKVVMRKMLVSGDDPWKFENGKWICPLCQRLAEEGSDETS